MLPTMYQGYALVLCLIPNFLPFTNQTLSIAGNNPPDGEQIEYRDGGRAATFQRRAPVAAYADAGSDGSHTAVIWARVLCVRKICRIFDLLAIGRVVPRYGERLICKWKEVRNQTQD